MNRRLPDRFGDILSNRKHHRVCFLRHHLAGFQRGGAFLLTGNDVVGREDEAAEKLSALEKDTGQKVMTMSAVSGKNTDAVLYKLADIVKIKKAEEHDAL